ncbi:hypothetical protein FOA52_008204 [Chlamydomonas sp. UWO 241]|nr:hypothetical protein FOA52_008204 [Chlamydomonas sp. UWO 241]
MRANADNTTAIYTASKEMEQSMAEAENARKLQMVKVCVWGGISADGQVHCAALRCAALHCTAHTQADHATEAAIYRIKKELEESRAQDENETAMHELNLASAARVAALKAADAEKDEELTAFRQARSLAREAEAADQELSLLKRRLAEEQAMGPASLARLSLQTTQAIYARLPLSDVRLVNVNSGGGCDAMNPMGALLPGVMAMHAATAAAATGNSAHSTRA